ncbi:hypothetical protein C3L33_11595, partial [Rhododendron williamsianum]
MRLRRSARRTMLQLSNTPGFEHDPLVPFLALNYYDRCISRHPIPEDWYFGLFVIGCTTLAWKMRANGLSVEKLLGARPIRVGGELIEVEVGHVDRMESLINSALNQRRRSIRPSASSTTSDARFTKFRPSIIALVGIIAEREDGLGDFWDHVFGSEFVDLNDLDQIENCLNLLDMIRAEKIVEAAVEPKIVGMWVETLRSWPDDEVAVAGELSDRVQQLRRSSRRI